MWQTSTRKLFLAILWFAVAFAALRFKTSEPYGIVIASLAMAYALFALFDSRWFATSERTAVVVMTSMLIGFLSIIGLAFALLGR